jgi:hypothetical protein
VQARYRSPAGKPSDEVETRLQRFRSLGHTTRGRCERFRVQGYLREPGDWPPRDASGTRPARCVSYDLRFCTAHHQSRRGGNQEFLHDARGNGPVARALTTRPANLTKLTAKNHGQFPVGRVKAFIGEGRPGLPAHGSPEMPVWGPVFQSLDPSDPVARARIDNVVAYLISIQAK